MRATAPSAPVPSIPELPLPPRAPDADGGTKLMLRMGPLSAAEREAMITREVLAGNVPSFIRRLTAVDLEVRSRSGAQLTGRVFVTADYLSLGSDDDFVRIPITIRTARKLAKELGCVLPTPRLVDAIHQAASVHVTSPTLPPGTRMGSLDYFVFHNQKIEQRRAALGADLGALLSGPKKDVVITRRMLEVPGRTPIYGWFGGDGHAVQPLSLVHDDRYADYAHGIRLVLRGMTVDGAPRDLLDVLADRELAPLVSDEGAADLRVLWERDW
ncbi:MAG: hypothetical protein IPM79_04940 [Polyangiaceae bacterium]|nr:hypothetical protein [Polyangiaceae bacterium]MBK8936991.1 hypothetical protein [Polyangiaceae bacterium]